MGYIILTPQSSFVRFDNESPIQHCIHGEFSTCLPVFLESDISFQFVIQASTPEEAGALCSPYSSGIDIGIVRRCDQLGFDLEFTETPQRFRISELQVLFNWTHGVPGMTGEIAIGECFYIRVVVGVEQFCTNCFQRIPDDCFTSVVEYGNDDNFGGFNYCNAGAVPASGETTCAPQIIEFTNQTSVVIPYTASLQDKFGAVPTVQVWVYDEHGNLTNMGVVATFDNMPPSVITVDPGGVSSGIVVIR